MSNTNSATQREWQEDMTVISTAVTMLISQRPATCSKEAAVKAALIGVLGYIRLDGMDEERLLSETRRECPSGKGLLKL